MRCTTGFGAGILAGLCSLSAASQQKEGGQSVYSGLPYAVVDGRELKLDLSLPEHVSNPPLVVYFHGGGWRKGARSNNRCRWVVAHGYAVASASYRLTDSAIFPAELSRISGRNSATSVM